MAIILKELYMSEQVLSTKAVYFGTDSRKKLVEELKSRDYQRILFVCAEGKESFTASKQVTTLFAQNRIVYQIFYKSYKPATYTEARSLSDMICSFRADAVVALGSSGAMDVAKAACVLAANPEIKDLRKSTITRAKVNGVPLFEILVSPASPRDFSYVSIIEDDAGRRKIVYREPMAVPQIIVWDDKVNDAALSVNYPYFAVASLAHAIESYVSKNSWAVSDSYALQAISLIGQNLSGAVKGNAKSRENVVYGQYLAGLSYSCSGAGALTAAANAFEASCGIDSFRTIPYMFAEVLRFISPSTGTKFRDVAIALGAKVSPTATPDSSRKACVAAIEKIIKELGLAKKKIEGIEISKDDMSVAADNALKDPEMECSPKPLNKKKITDLLKLVC